MSRQRLGFMDLLILWALLAVADVAIVGLDDLREATWFIAANTVVLAVYALVLSVRK